MTSSVATQQLLKQNFLSVHQVHLEVIPTLKNPWTRQVTPTIKALSSAEAPKWKFFNNIGFGRASSIPQVLPFSPLLRPTATFSYHSTQQHKRGLCRGERFSLITDSLILLDPAGTLGCHITFTVFSVNPFTTKGDSTDFTLSNATQFYSSKEDPWQ